MSICKIFNFKLYKIGKYCLLNNYRDEILLGSPTYTTCLLYATNIVQKPQQRTTKIITFLTKGNTSFAPCELK